MLLEMRCRAAAWEAAAAVTISDDPTGVARRNTTAAADSDRLALGVPQRHDARVAGEAPQQTLRQ